MYCDVCGSFAIKHWIAPDNYQELEKQADLFNKATFIFAIITFLAIIPAIMGYPAVLGISFIPLIISMFGARIINRKIHYLGVRCEKCATTYEKGSSFFTDLEENPRNYTLADVPRPLYEVYQIKGEQVEED